MTLTFRRRPFCSYVGPFKSRFRVSCLTTTWLAAAFFLALFIGCATAPAFKSLDALGTSVDSAVNVYYRLVATRQIPTNSVPAVSQAYAQFQFLYRIAEAQMESNPRGGPDTNVVAHAAKVLNVVSQAQKGGQ